MNDTADNADEPKQYSKDQLVSELVSISKTHLSMMASDRKWARIRTVLFATVLVLPTLVYVWALVIAGSEPDAYGADLSDGYAAMVRIEGAISPGGEWSARKINAALERAFRDEEAKGVVIAINSPGGSPVQSSIINRKIRQLREEYGKEVVAVGADYMTSGAYWAAVAADKVYANPSSITGSIGVIMEKVAYAGIAERLGVERRVYTAGEFKDRFNGWQAETPEDHEKARSLLGHLHGQFRTAVIEARGDKLAAEREGEIFSGDFWTGEEALAMGLLDGLADVDEAIQQHWGVQYAKDYSPSSPFASLIQRLRGSAASLLGTQLHIDLY